MTAPGADGDPMRPLLALTAYGTTNGDADGGGPATVWPVVGGGALDDIEFALA